MEKKNIDQLNIKLSHGVLKELKLRNRDEAVTTVLEEVFNVILKMEADEQVGALIYDHSPDRLTYRNGYRDRNLTTRVGSLMLHIPKFRDETLLLLCI